MSEIIDMRNIFNRIDEYIYGDKLILEKIKKVVEKIKPITDPYIHCDKTLIKKIEGYIDNYNKLKNATIIEEECCICLEESKFEQRSYFMCKHFVCNTCYNMSELKIGSSRCPICRTIIQQLSFTDKYAIICTGIPTKFYTFENGGYKTMCIVYFPEFEGEKCTTFVNITYYDENISRLEFIQKINLLFSNNYSIILQKHKEIRRWMNEVMLKDLVYDARFLYE